MAAVSAEQFSHQPRALVVDDSQIARYILSGQLERLGFVVEVAESAEAALRQVNGSLPDVVFMDHLLPGIDGLEAVSRMRGQSRTADVPIVMYTSQDSESFAERALNTGANEIYVKTEDEARLAVILNKLEMLPTRARASTPEVTPIRRSARRPLATVQPSVSREKLARLLEPSLEAHHAKLHQELLGEFAILERYEERMRQDLFTRIDVLVKRTDQRIDENFVANRVQKRRYLAWTWSLAASFALAFVASVLVVWDSAERTEILEASAIATTQVIDANTDALFALQNEVAERISDEANLDRPADSTWQENRMAPTTRVSPPDAAAVLVTELQSMGILGPVRIETGVGSFCVSTSPRGLEFAGTLGTLRDCESLPVQLVTGNRLN